MKFKDRLRELRNERQLTQKQLGEKIFVSRSAVAKWENGLGLPSEASYEALLVFFNVTREEFVLNEKEEVPDIKKNRIRHAIFATVEWVMILLVAVFPFFLLYGVFHGYGFTSEMAAGEIWSDNELIEGGSYDFYLSSSPIQIIDENGDVIDYIIDGFCAVEHRFYGYQKLDLEEYKKEVYDGDGELYGIIYSFSDSKGCYNFFKGKKVIEGYTDEDGSYRNRTYVNLLPSVIIDGTEVAVRDNSYFVTENLPDVFYSGEGKKLTVR